MKSPLPWGFKILAITVLTPLALIFTAALIAVLAFFAIPEIEISPGQIHWTVDHFVPQTIALEFSDLSLKIQRPSDNWLAKRIELTSHGLCLDLKKKSQTGAHICFKDQKMAFTAGWQNSWVPHVLSIEPILLIGGNVSIDLAVLRPDSKPSQDRFDWIGFARKDLIPVWRVHGSTINVESLTVQTDSTTRINTDFSLTAESLDQVHLRVRHLKSNSSPLTAQGSVELEKSAQSWLAQMNAHLDLDSHKSVEIKGTSQIRSTTDLSLQLESKWRGIDTLREARIESTLKNSEVTGLISARLGSDGGEVQALGFDKCSLTADLDQKIGALNCGPETVRLLLRKQNLVEAPGLYLLQPEFELKVSRLEFGREKSAAFEFHSHLKHLNFADLDADAHGDARLTADGILYHILGEVGLAVPAFETWVEVFRKTPYAVPAPLNTLRGTTRLDAKLDLNQDGGAVTYHAATKLDSKTEAVHLELKGETRLHRINHQLLPATVAELGIRDLRVSAPRFELATPPRLVPDSRFGPLVRAAVETTKKVPHTDFHLRVYTLANDAIHVSTNLTKAPIPISLDLFYEDRASSTYKLSSRLSPQATSPSLKTRAANELQGSDKPENLHPGFSPVSGWVIVDTTPLELFKRNATFQKIRLDLKSDGEQLIDGQILVSYLDYDIRIFLTGNVDKPDVRFESDPPLNDDQVISVLIFGRPLDELGDDQKSSVSNLNAAITDAVLDLSSLYLLASTPIQSVGYDSSKSMVTAQVGLGAGTSLQVGGGNDTSGLGVRKRLSKDFTLRSDVERIGTTGEETVSVLIEWVKRF